MVSSSQAVLILDYPQNGVVSTPLEQLWGWVRVSDSSGEMNVQINGQNIAFARIVRPNLDPKYHLGFSIFLDLPSLAQRLQLTPGQLNVDILLDNLPITTIQLEVTGQALENTEAIVYNRVAKRAFIEKNVTINLQQLDDCSAPSALPFNWEINPSILCKQDAVSCHMYGKTVIDFLSKLPKSAFILDAGAGFRKKPHPNVINMEIYDYPSTDILAIGQKLPFQDNCFDAILSLAVLEHVDDPFLCAQELVRVLKPGGQILVIVPFLQPEHGYPSHFFNCTRFGLKRLFASAIPVDHFLEISNLPIFTLYSILSQYAGGLTQDYRDEFLNMKVSDILARTPTEYVLAKHPMVTELNEDTNWRLAFGTTAIFEKNSKM
jgi:SAM-dependent methyltransferase